MNDTQMPKIGRVRENIQPTECFPPLAQATLTSRDFAGFRAQVGQGEGLMV